MTANWKNVTASEVKPGDRVRLASGAELLVSRVEAPFLGRAEMVAFIEDTSTRWFKQPVPTGMNLEVQTDD